MHLPIFQASVKLLVSLSGYITKLHCRTILIIWKMERKRSLEQEFALVKELTQGKDLTELLKINIQNSASLDLCDPIIQNIIAIYDKVISMLTLEKLAVVTNPEATSQSIQNVHKKRKTMAGWDKQVRVSSKTGGSELSDGSSWRKYGQKAILGAKFPRAYYRCTHRHVQGCLATKQVQRSDEDPSLFLVSYHGKHSCISSFAAQRNHLSDSETKIPKQHHQSHSQNQNLSNDFIGLDLGAVKTERIPSFSFPSTKLDTTNSFESYISPASFEENSFLDNFNTERDGFWLADQHFQVSDLDIISTPELNSAQGSTTNSPIGISDFSFDQLEFLSDLPFDTCQFFS